MDSFGVWWKSNEFFLLHWIIILKFCVNCKCPVNSSAVTRTDELVKMVNIHNARRRDRFVGSCDRRRIVCSEMFKLSRNNQNIKMFGVPPNTLPLVIYIGYFHFVIFWVWLVYITTCHSKHLPVGLMVLTEYGPLSEDRDFFF